jgi:quinol monooxygenase YgiN
MAIGIIATLKVQPEKANEAEEAFRDLQKQVTSNEEGCLFYSFFKAAEGEYVVLESYKDDAALAHHGQTDYFKAAGKKMAGFMAAPPDIKRMPSV